MPLSGDDLICPKFQPNIFDSSRCHDCLRQKHLHAGTDTAPQVSPGTDSSQGQQPVPEERDSSTKEDSDAQSVVSSYCDVSEGQRGYEESSLHILSPDCQLYLCDGDDDEDSTDSQDDCDYLDFFHSTSADDDYHPVHRRSTYSSMTRLDPPPHRPNPRAWMEESRSRDSFGRHSVGSREDRDRESGYFSLGKAGGIRSFRDQSPPAPFRHSERGHPIPSTRSPEPKDTIPFRNRDLGVPSHRRGTELQNADYLEESPPPEPTPLERSIEVEAQVGPRSPSPTPFKQAEALASNRRGFSGSFSKAKSPSSHSSSQQQSRRGASLSRSSSPALSTSSFKRSESVTLLNSRNLSSAFTQGFDHRSRSPPSQNSYSRGLDLGGAQRNFRSIASSVGSKSHSGSYADLRGSLRKAESTTSVASRGLTSRSSSPSKRGYDTPGQSMLRKSETNGSLGGHNRDTRGSSPSRRGYDTPGQSMLRKSETNGSLGGHNRDTRGSSPSRRGHDTPGQSMLRKSETNGSLGGHNRDTRSSSPSKRGCDTPGQSMLRKSETNGSLGGHNRDTRSSSPSRRGHDTPGQSMLRKSETNGSLGGHNRDTRSSSPSRRGHDTPGQSTLRKSETNGSLGGHNRDTRSSSPSRRGYDTPGQSMLRKSETNGSLGGHNRDTRSSSPSRRGHDTPGQSMLRKSETNGSLGGYDRDTRSSSPSKRGYDTTSQSMLCKSETRISTNAYGLDRRNTSPSRTSYDHQGQSFSQKTEKKTTSHGRDSPPLSRKGFDSTRPSIKHKSEAKGSLSRSSSPSRNGYDISSQSVLRFTETSRPKHCQGQDSRSPSPSRSGYDTPRQSLQRKSETDSSRSLSGHNSRSSSPSKTGTDSSSQSALRKTVSYDSRPNATSSYTKKTVNSHGKSDSNPSPGSWRGSSHSLCSPPTSRSPSPSRKTSENRPLERSQRSSSAVLGNSRSGSRSSSCSRHVTEHHGLTPEMRKSSGQNRSQSPHMRRLTSSQSSMDSTASSHLSGGSTGFNKEEYAMMADLPKVKTVFQREGPNHLGRLESHHSGEGRLYKPASHSHTKSSYSSWDSGGDHQDGRLTRTHSSTSLHLQRACSPTMEKAESCEGQQRSPRQSQRTSQGRPSVYFSPSVESAEESPIEQPDLLNFKKGWMSKLDEKGEWKKHWFVLTDAGLRYYRDSGAEEKDDLDGEIDLKSCVKVSEYDVEKNYGFQIHTREAVVTLSAMTAGIRRNWIEVLRKSVRPSSSPDLTQLPDGNSDKENSHTRSLPSVRRHHSQSQSHADTSTSGSTQRRFDYVELSPVAAPGGLGSSTQREAGEGQVREGGSWREEEQRSRESTASQWEAVLARKGPGQGRQRLQEEIERKWAEFERLPLKEMRSLPVTLGSRASSSSPASEALQREVASLRQQLEHLKKGGEGGGVGGGETGRKKEEEGVEGGGRGGTRGECGPLAPCGRSLRAMELAHGHALEELQKQHVREVQELLQERDRLLQEETQATEKAMEVLKKAHREELERELERARRLGSAGTDATTLSAQQRAEMATLQRELQGLSERYSQKCLELKRAEQGAEEREREASRREREMQLLRQENQDLQARLTEEINRMRSLVTGQGLEGIADANRERKSCELEVLLRVKENEVLYLQKEISCLRNELQCLNLEKRSACARYKEVHEELSSMKSRSEREIQSLREHLKLAMAALQEGQRLGNSLEH